MTRKLVSEEFGKERAGGFAAWWVRSRERVSGWEVGLYAGEVSGIFEVVKRGGGGEKTRSVGGWG